MMPWKLSEQIMVLLNAEDLGSTKMSSKDTTDIFEGPNPQQEQTFFQNQAALITELQLNISFY